METAATRAPSAWLTRAGEAVRERRAREAQTREPTLSVYSIPPRDGGGGVDEAVVSSTTSQRARGCQPLPSTTSSSTMASLPTPVRWRLQPRAACPPRSRRSTVCVNAAAAGTPPARPRICVLGGGFGGLYAALRLESLVWPTDSKPEARVVQDASTHAAALLRDVADRVVTRSDARARYSALIAPLLGAPTSPARTHARARRSFWWTAATASSSSRCFTSC